MPPIVELRLILKLERFRLCFQLVQITEGLVSTVLVPVNCNKGGYYVQ